MRTVLVTLAVALASLHPATGLVKLNNNTDFRWEPITGHLAAIQSCDWLVQV